MSRVLLVNMPWSAVSIPSLGLGLLSSILKNQGIQASIYYANIHYSQILVHHHSSLLHKQESSIEEMEDNERGFLVQESDARDLVDEYIFSSIYYAYNEEENQKYWDLYLSRDGNRQSISRWQEAQKLIPRFYDEAIAEIKDRNCRIIGFTAMFGQNISSLALARRIKQEIPGSIIIFGGANCDGEMGEALLRNFDQIDYVVSGEAEYSLPQLVSSIENGGLPTHIKGVIWRDAVGLNHHNGLAPALTDLDCLPFPDFDDYFEALQKSSLHRYVTPTIFLEQSRGCWWGQKQHCTFCGLNGDNMVYRTKSDDRCLQELRIVSRELPATKVHFADNILGMSRFVDFFPMLRKENLGLSLFFEIKSNVSAEMIKVMRAAGVYSVQPGIENFSSSVLKIMRKGVTGLQNVQCLKWCKQYEILVNWNLLYGFPGETDADYEINLGVMRSITHLDRPQYGLVKIRLDRFSPNYNEALRHGFDKLRPERAYQHVYSLPEEEISKLCYSFDYDYLVAPDVTAATAALMQFCQQWADCSDPGDVVYLQLEQGGALILDTRFNIEQRCIKLSPSENQLLCYLDRIRTDKSIMKFSSECGWDTDRDIMAYVRKLESQRLVISDGNRYLSVVPLQAESNADPQQVRPSSAEFSVA